MDNPLLDVTEVQIDELVINLIPRWKRIRKLQQKRRGKVQVLSGEWITNDELLLRNSKYK